MNENIGPSNLARRREVKIQVHEIVLRKKEKDLKHRLSTLPKSAMEGLEPPLQLQKEERSCVYVPL